MTSESRAQRYARRYPNDKTDPAIGPLTRAKNRKTIVTSGRRAAKRDLLLVNGHAKKTEIKVDSANPRDYFRSRLNRQQIDIDTEIRADSVNAPKLSKNAENPLEKLRENLLNFLGKVAGKNYLTRGQQRNFKTEIDSATIPSKLTEIQGEIVLAHFIRKLGGEAVSEWSAGTGIDALSLPNAGFRNSLNDEFQRSNTVERNKDILKQLAETCSLYVFETKGPGAGLTKNDGSGFQMSAFWVAQKVVAGRFDKPAAIAAGLNPTVANGKDAADIQQRIDWVRANTLPILITASRYRAGGNLSAYLGMCEVLQYRDRFKNMEGNFRPETIAWFKF